MQVKENSQSSSSVCLEQTEIIRVEFRSSYEFRTRDLKHFPATDSKFQFR